MSPSRRLLFAANWKMNLGPAEARSYAERFRLRYRPAPERETWFFPPAVSLEAAARAWEGMPNTLIGAQDLHWEPKGAFTGATSAALARAAGARAALIGHSERRHLFGETDADTARKLEATIREGLIPVLCVGETLAQRERGETEAVVRRQLLAAVEGSPPSGLGRLVIAYEPVWAIGTGRNATPADGHEQEPDVAVWAGELEESPQEPSTLVAALGRRYVGPTGRTVLVAFDGQFLDDPAGRGGAVVFGPVPPDVVTLFFELASGRPVPDVARQLDERLGKAHGSYSSCAGMRRSKNPRAATVGAPTAGHPPDRPAGPAGGVLLGIAAPASLQP